MAENKGAIKILDKENIYEEINLVSYLYTRRRDDLKLKGQNAFKKMKNLLKSS